RRSASGLDRHFHFRQSMSIRRDHAHHVGLELPKHTVEDRPAFLGRDSERCVGDELLKVSGANPPAFVEANVWKRGELVARKSENLEVRAAAIECDALLSRRGDANWSRR